MIEAATPFVQTLLGTLFTWGLTAAGAALVFVFSSGQRKVLDGSLGFAAGVMTAASYWSLLAPAIEMAQESGVYGENGEWSFIPAAVGFYLGAVFVWTTDKLLPHWGDPAVALAHQSNIQEETDPLSSIPQSEGDEINKIIHDATTNDGTTRRRRMSRRQSSASDTENDVGQVSESAYREEQYRTRWQRILLLIIAITVHNIPEGLAVGVGFGAVGKSASATFANARNLAIGIGIQNFPEGLAVSLPLRAAGFSVWKSFWYGQLSGMVEPIAGLIGCLAVSLAEPILPYSLAFAAGAMIFVVVDDVIPEANTCGNGKLCSMGCIIGFIVMMSLDVGLG